MSCGDYHEAINSAEKAFSGPQTVWFGCLYKLEGQPVEDSGEKTIRVITPIQKSNKRTYPAIWQPEGGLEERQPLMASEPGIGPHEHLARINLADEDEILNFANRWGLLGLWEVSRYKKWQPTALFLGAGQKSKESSETPQEDEDSRCQPGVFSGKPQESPWFGRGGLYDRQEPVPAFQRAAWDYQQLVNRIAEFREIKDAEQRQEAAQTIINGFDGEKFPFFQDSTVSDRVPGLDLLAGEETVSPQITWDEGTRAWLFGWKYRSLLHAIYFNAFLDMVERKESGGGFSRCKNNACKRLFIAIKTNQKYCSRRCEKAQTTRKLRERRKKEQQ